LKRKRKPEDLDNMQKTLLRGKREKTSYQGKKGLGMEGRKGAAKKHRNTKKSLAPGKGGGLTRGGNIGYTSRKGET